MNKSASNGWSLRKVYRNSCLFLLIDLHLCCGQMKQTGHSNDQFYGKNEQIICESCHAHLIDMG